MRRISHLATKLTLALGLTVGLASPLAACLTTRQACAAEAVTETKPDMKRVTAHLRAHVTYPATRAQLLSACAATSEFTDGEKAWFAARLPEGTYQNAKAVLKAVGN